MWRADLPRVPPSEALCEARGGDGRQHRPQVPFAQPVRGGTGIRTFPAIGGGPAGSNTVSEHALPPPDPLATGIGMPSETAAGIGRCVDAPRGAGRDELDGDRLRLDGRV